MFLNCTEDADIGSIKAKPVHRGGFRYNGMTLQYTG